MELNAKPREETGRKVNSKRKEGFVPAVLYGNKNEPMSVWLDANEIRRMYEGAGETTVIQLNVDTDKDRNVLIHDIQFDPLDETIVHVDLFEVDMKKKVDADVELVFVGESPAVKEDGGTFMRGIDILPVRCFPADLPSDIQIDISVLKTFDDAIRVKDLLSGDKVETTYDANTIVASVAAPKAQIEDDTTEEVVDEAPAAENKEAEASQEENKG